MATRSQAIYFSQYKWIKADEPDKGNQGKKKRTKTLDRSFGLKTTIREECRDYRAAMRRTRSAESIGVSRRMKPISSEDVKSGPGLPWRTAARANIYRGYPPEHVPGHTSLMEKSENYAPQNSLNYTSINVIHHDNEETEETESSMQEEFERLKLDDSALSTAVAGNGIKVEIVQLRRQINKKRLARHKAEQKVVEVV